MLSSRLEMWCMKEPGFSSTRLIYLAMRGCHIDFIVGERNYSIQNTARYGIACIMHSTSPRDPCCWDCIYINILSGRSRVERKYIERWASRSLPESASTVGVPPRTRSHSVLDFIASIWSSSQISHGITASRMQLNAPPLSLLSLSEKEE